MYLQINLLQRGGQLKLRRHGSQIKIRRRHIIQVRVHLRRLRRRGIRLGRLRRRGIRLRRLRRHGIQVNLHLGRQQQHLIQHVQPRLRITQRVQPRPYTIHLGIQLELRRRRSIQLNQR